MLGPMDAGWVQRDTGGQGGPWATEEPNTDPFSSWILKISSVLAPKSPASRLAHLIVQLTFVGHLSFTGHSAELETHRLFIKVAPALS